MPIKRNAVQLVAVDGGDGGPVGLGPVRVTGAFDMPLGHLALDEAWVRPVSSDRVEAPA